MVCQPNGKRFSRRDIPHTHCAVTAPCGQIAAIGADGATLQLRSAGAEWLTDDFSLCGIDDEHLAEDCYNPTANITPK